MRHVLDELVEDALRELADESEQRELWLAAEGPLVSSYVECISRLWDDSGLADALDGTGVIWSAAIDDQFRDLRGVTRRIDGLRPPDEILTDPCLARARLMAHRLLTDLRTFGAEPD